MLVGHAQIQARVEMAVSISTPIVFSPSGEYCMISSPDGVLKLWETSTSKLSQQYTPSSHLTATCTCLSWGPKKHTDTSVSLLDLNCYCLKGIIYLHSWLVAIAVRPVSQFKCMSWFSSVSLCVTLSIIEI